MSQPDLALRPAAAWVALPIWSTQRRKSRNCKRAPTVGDAGSQRTAGQAGSFNSLSRMPLPEAHADERLGRVAIRTGRRHDELELPSGKLEQPMAAITAAETQARNARARADLRLSSSSSKLGLSSSRMRAAPTSHRHVIEQRISQSQALLSYTCCHRPGKPARSKQLSAARRGRNRGVAGNFSRQTYADK